MGGKDRPAQARRIRLAHQAGGRRRPTGTCWIHAKFFARRNSKQRSLGLRPDEGLVQGDSSGLLGWLRIKVHREGQRRRPAELIERVTGSKPDRP